MNEQSAGAQQIVQAVATMRQGAASTARALGEQLTATDQVSREMDRLAGQVMRVTKAMAEQAGNAEGITTTADGLRLHASQVSRGMEEQGTAMKRITAETTNISKQIRSITAANYKHAQTASSLRERFDNCERLNLMAPRAGAAVPARGSSSRQSRRSRRAGLAFQTLTAAGQPRGALAASGRRSRERFGDSDLP